MSKALNTTTLWLSVVTLFSATVFSSAQEPNQQPAPIVRSYTVPNSGIRNSQPAPGVFLRLAPNATVETVAATPEHTELRLTHGIANVSLHRPAPNALVLVDLPGGQTALLKDGYYTFNAETNTVRVLQGEAEAFAPNAPAGAKGIKVKEDHQLIFGTAPLRSQDVGPYDARTDLLAAPRDNHGDGPAYGYPGYGFYGYPYYAYGYGYPYGFYGYPYVGLGFGYYGGYYGGFRGGFGGFRR
jgi:hypothetical protein